MSVKSCWLCAAALGALLFASCSVKMLPAEDNAVFEYCKDEIAVLKDPTLSPNSRQKYEAALAISKKIDFSYVRTIDFLGRVFLEADAKVNRTSATEQTILIYYPYRDSFVSFEFTRYQDQIIRCEIRVK